MTAKDAIKLAHDSVDHTYEIRNFILNATLSELQDFIHGIWAHPDNKYFNWAKTALDIQIAKDAEILNRRIFLLTAVLVVLTVTLVFLTYKLAYPGQDAPPNSQSQTTTLPNSSANPSPP